MSLLEQDTTTKRQIKKLFSKPKSEFDASDNKEYKVEIIKDNAIYAKEIEKHLTGIYYLVFWKGYPEKKRTWEPSSAIMHLWKMISTFYKNYPKKPIATSLSLNFTLPKAKPSVKPAKPSIKQK